MRQRTDILERMQVHGYNNNLSAPEETQDVEVG